MCTPRATWKVLLRMLERYVLRFAIDALSLTLLIQLGIDVLVVRIPANRPLAFIPDDSLI